MNHRPYRSVLYVPASNPRAVEKALTLPVDAIILDLEDAVAPGAKSEARAAVAGAAGRPRGHRALLVRINGQDTPWGADDARAVADLPAGSVEAVLVPKVNGPGDLDAVARLVPGLPLWAMMETAAGVLAAAAIAGHPRIGGLVMGSNDLGRELGLRERPDRAGLLASLGLCLLAARAHGRVILDGVYNALRDQDGLGAECAAGRDLGFDGKTLIHPAQIEAANRAFAPSRAELDQARWQIAAHEAAVAAGQGVAVLDGRIVEGLHVATALRLLSRAEAIAKAREAH